MINPIAFLWKQFNGPQITAICQAVWEYFRDTYDSTLDYLHSMKIATADDKHLTTLGALHGLARPLVPIPDEKMLVWGEEYEYVEDEYNPGHLIPATDYPSQHGMNDSELDGGPNAEATQGGLFDYESSISGYKHIPAYVFRGFLQGSANSKGVLGSIAAIDDMLYQLWRTEHGSVIPVYKISWVWSQVKNRFQQGDIFVDLGVTGDWNYPYETQAEIKLLGNTVYYPIPKLIPKLVLGDSQIDPFGFIRILLKTEDNVYGLDSMWAGEGTPADTEDDGSEPEFSVEPITEAMLSLMWAQDNTWIDEEAPTLEFVALEVDAIENMWK